MRTNARRELAAQCPNLWPSIDDAAPVDADNHHRDASPEQIRPVTTGETLMSLSVSRPVSVPAAALRSAIIGLTLATAYIHFTLGGLLFLANATGYVALAGAMALPLTFASDLRWLTRLALMGYATATIVGWAIMGPYFTLAYVAKGIEVALIVLLMAEQYREVGGPLTVARRLVGLASTIAARVRGRTSAPAGI